MQILTDILARPKMTAIFKLLKHHMAIKIFVIIDDSPHGVPSEKSKNNQFL